MCSNWGKCLRLWIVIYLSFFLFLFFFFFSLSSSSNHVSRYCVPPSKVIQYSGNNNNSYNEDVSIMKKRNRNEMREKSREWEREKEGERRDDEVRWMSARMGLKKEMMMMNKMILMQRIIYNTIFFAHFLLILISSLSHPSYIFYPHIFLQLSSLIPLRSY